MDDGVDRYLGINRRDKRFLARKICRYVRRAGVIFDDQYERPIVHSRGAVHARVLECWQERTAVENELSRVVNAVATVSLIENSIDRIVDRGSDTTNHKLMHRKRKGESNAIRYSRKRKFRQH